MELFYNDLRVRGKIIVYGGILELDETGVYLVHGDNGTGKTLLLNNIHTNANGLTVLVPQGNTEIVRDMTVEENIAMQILDSPDEWVRELLSKYNLSYLLHLEPRKLSGGENRIISLLRGVFSSAPVVLIDEPTNDLDFSMVEKLVAIISDFALHKCFLIVTHDDRLDSIAKGSVAISNNRVRDDGPNKVCLDMKKSHSKFDPLEDKGLDLDLIGYVWKRGANVVGIIVLILMCILSAYKLSTRVAVDHDETMYIPGNQVNIMRCHASHATIGPQGHGILPISVMDDILSGSLWFKAQDIVDIMNSTNLPVRQDLPKLYSSENFTVYPIEYFADRHYLSILRDIYLANFIDVSTEFAWVDTTGYFYSEPGLGKRVDFDPVLFAESVAEAETLISTDGNKYKPIHYTIVLGDGFSVKDLLKEIPGEFLSDTTYIQTKETIAVGTEIATIVQYQDIIKVMAQWCGILLSIEAAYILLYCTFRSREIRILANYGYGFQTVRETVQKLSSDKLIRVLLCLALIGLIRFHPGANASKYVFANYALAVIVAVTTFIGYGLKRLAINFMIKQIYSWKFR